MQRSYVFCALFGIAGAMPAFADVTVREHVNLVAPAEQAQGMLSRQISADRERRVIQLACERSNPACAHESLKIVRLDRNVIWQINPGRKQYSEILLPTNGPKAFRGSGAAMQPMDTSKCEMSPPLSSVEKTQETATLVGHESQRTTLTSTQSCKVRDTGDACELRYSLDVWLTREEIPGIAERQSFQSAYDKKAGLDEALFGDAKVQAALLPYTDNLRQLTDSASDLKGYALKSIFRFSYRGAHCPLVVTHSSNTESNGVVGNAGKAAVAAATDSLAPAAGWGAAGAVERATGNGIPSYVAGSASGSFTQNLIGGLMGKATRSRPAGDTRAQALGAEHVDARSNATILVELSLETTAIETAPIPAGAFEIPTGWKKVDAIPARTVATSGSMPTHP